MQRKYYKYTKAYMNYLIYHHQVSDCVCKLCLKHRLSFGTWKEKKNFFKVTLNKQKDL